MENYIVSARKYRPSSFKTVVGQKSLTQTLKSAIDSNRLAHAYLFCGPRGVGKTSCARIFAKTINCLNPTDDKDACNCCESCVAFNEQRSYNIVELDAASNNSVDNIRTLTEQVRIPPQVGKYKVFIIDEVHMLSSAAFNAFLKTLEEPPAHAIFILATTEKHKIIPTILSRCQIYDFSRITVQDMVEQLQFIAQSEGITADTQSLNIIAQKADGAMRDALSIFDQVAASSQGVITYASTIENLNVLDYEYYFRLVDAFITADVPQALLVYNEIRCNGFDSLFFINGLASHLRDLMVASNAQTVSLLELGDDIKARYMKQVQSIPVSFLYKALDICNDCDLNYRIASNKQLLIELSLIKLCQILDNPTPPTNTGEKIKPINTTNTNSVATTATPQAVKQSVATPKPTPTANPQVATPQKVVAKVATPPSVSIKTATSTRVAVAPTISISGIKKPESATVAQQTATIQTVNTLQTATFSDEQFVKVWKKYIESNPTERLLVNAMRISTPIRVSGERFSMELANVGLVDVIKTNLGKLLTYLRGALGNNNITLETTVNENIETAKMLSPTDIITDIMSRNKGVRTLIQKFELGLA
ncbi:MAG: DNA polymerase III subunit gamma/tau [Bacteroidales bacterium]